MTKLEIFLYGAIAALGGLTKYANQVIAGRREFNPKKFRSWVVLCVELLTSFFVGMLVYYFSSAYHLSTPLSYGLAGVAGHFGGGVFDLIRKLVELKVGLKTDE